MQDANEGVDYIYTKLNRDKCLYIDELSWVRLWECDKSGSTMNQKFKQFRQGEQLP